jgi:hypothetical protein
MQDEICGTRIRFVALVDPSAPPPIFKGGILNLSIIPLQPQKSPLNPSIRPFAGYRFGYLHPHGNIPHVRLH